MTRDVLYHGTPHRQSVRDTNVLFRLLTGGDPTVCLTRIAEVTAYWSLTERDDDEGRGSIFIFDRRSLERQHKIIVNPHTTTKFDDETEEQIFEDPVNVSKRLIGIVSGGSIWRSAKLPIGEIRALKRARRLEMPDCDSCRVKIVPMAVQNSLVPVLQKMSIQMSRNTIP
jgi:hypothetical protein